MGQDRPDQAPRHREPDRPHPHAWRAHEGRGPSRQGRPRGGAGEGSGHEEVGIPRTMRITTLLVPMSLAVVCGCTPAPPPAIPVTSAAGDTRLLAGKWQGDFWSSQTGRHGKISFQMAAGSDSATSQVLMYFRSPAQAIWTGDATSLATKRPAELQWLSIRFVDVEGGALSGEIAPYTDPI